MDPNLSFLDSSALVPTNFSIPVVAPASLKVGGVVAGMTINSQPADIEPVDFTAVDVGIIGIPDPFVADLGGGLLVGI